jgi:hypothetical protein
MRLKRVKDYEVIYKIYGKPALQNGGSSGA